MSVRIHTRQQSLNELGKTHDQLDASIFSLLYSVVQHLQAVGAFVDGRFAISPFLEPAVPRILSVSKVLLIPSGDPI